MPLIHCAYVPYGADAFQSGEYGTWYGGYQVHAEPGDIVFYQFYGPGTAFDHTGIVVRDDDDGYITTIEGNTTAPGGSGSQSNGGGVFLKSREKNSLIAGFGRPRYPKAVTVPASFIRWGSEARTIGGTSGIGSTLLHHHYFHAEHGRQVPDPAATRSMALGRISGWRPG
jgi:CHAP domain